MEDYNFEDELECLKSCYDSSEFSYRTLGNSDLLKFSIQKNASVTFEIPSAYPQIPPFVSVMTADLTNTERSKLEHEARCFAEKSIGYPMIMDLVVKIQQLMNDYCKRNDDIDERQSTENNNLYIAVVLINHMRQKRKYCNTLLSWAAEMHIFGCLLFYKRWIFLILQGSKKDVKDFIIRLKTVCIDVDSSGKPCKEKMSTVLYEGINSGTFTGFSIKEVTSVGEMEILFTQSEITSIFQDVIKPIINKSQLAH